MLKSTLIKLKTLQRNLIAIIEKTIKIKIIVKMTKVTIILITILSILHQNIILFTISFTF